MKHRILILLFLNLCILPFALPQNEGKKELKAIRITDRPKIDGILDDECWKHAEVAEDFIQYEPFNGKDPTQPTEVRLVYDDNSIYIAATMHDSVPDRIMREFGERDSENLNADYFMFGISPYNDGMNAFLFYLYASEVQMDVKLFSTGQDISWDAVWKGEVSFFENGWVAEMEVPYSAIRFPKQEHQTWGLNFLRHIRRNRETSSWNLIDKKIEGVVNQAGLLTNIQDIKPPLRLSFEPYIVSNLSQDPGSPVWETYFNGGMDLKFGINESYTLDMTLIPDFSQVQSDDQVVNLGPFETYYSEKRQFFTEGVELFSRGDIFYSRRVGSKPLGYDQVNDDYAPEDIIENPEETRLLNATKISGRNSRGTGIGLFNAFSAAAYATVRDSSGKEKEIMTQPFTNYNMLVFDQSLQHNSFISLYNTNVYRGKNEYSANVSGTEMNFRDRQNLFSAWGVLNVTQKYFPDDSPDIGFMYEVSLAKVRGNANYGIWQKMESDNYDPNDLGYESSNNEFETGIFFSYNTYEPFWVILESESVISVELDQLYAPREFTGFEIDFENRTLFKNILTVGFNGNLDPAGTRDYFEPRNPGWFVRFPPSYSFSGFYSPDYNKTFVLDIGSGVSWASEYEQLGYYLRLGPRYKINNHLSMVWNVVYNRNSNNLGYVTDSTDNDGLKIIFGKRDIENITVTYRFSYAINTKINLSFRLRHYFFKADYDQYYNLQPDGRLLETEYAINEDFTYSAFNIDAYFTWLFAPGSELVLAWKNAIYTSGELPAGNYFEELGETLQSPASNLISLKLLYYLDAQYFKRLKKKHAPEG